MQPATVQKMIISLYVAYMLARQPADRSWTDHRIDYDWEGAP